MQNVTWQPSCNSERTAIERHPVWLTDSQILTLACGRNANLVCVWVFPLDNVCHGEHTSAAIDGRWVELQRVIFESDYHV